MGKFRGSAAHTLMRRYTYRNGGYMWNWIKRIFGVNGEVDKNKCEHNWVVTGNRRYTSDLDDVEEKCTICGDTRIQDKW